MYKLCYDGPVFTEMKEEQEKVVGKVIEALPNTMFIVLVDPVPTKHTSNPAITAGESTDGVSEETQTEPVRMMCILSGKMRKYRIRVLIGDTVEVVLVDPNDRTKGRITSRQ